MSEHGSIKFWSEIGRRNVLRVAAVYVGFSWMVIHSGVVLGEALELPHWIIRLISALLIIGFPAVVAFAWVYELTPEGLKRTVEVEKNASLTHRTAQRLNVVIIALMVLLAGLYGADRFVLRHEAAEAGAHNASDGPAPTPAIATAVAVLPFVDLSPAKDQEYFSDGMTEEITSALAKIPNLPVVGRTSAFEFKGENKDLSAIGRALHAGYLLEGSVRKAENRVRITAQLIRAKDDLHVWTDSYDRDLKDVFAVQEDVAKAIAAALQVPLGLQAGENLVANRTADTESYQDYLRAKALYRQRALGTPLDEPIGILERSLARDPGYAPAWALLGDAYAWAPNYASAMDADPAEDLRRIVDLDLPKAETAARHAIALDARGADGYIALADTASVRGKFVEAEDLYRQGLKLDPYNPEGLHQYADLLATVGQLKQAVAIRRQLQSIEPLVPVFNSETAGILWAAGQDEAALAVLKALPSANMQRLPVLTHLYAARGQYKEAADTIDNAAAGIRSPGTAAAAVRLLRRAPQPAEDRNLPELGRFSFVYLYVGLPERSLDRQVGLVAAGYQPQPPFTQLFHPTYAAARKTARFKDLMRNSGRVAYWRARGWPDICHAVGKDDFACE